ncbi:MAG TPA: hypothetical protein VKJ45_20880 [Blastocatellia bacterium]|nr:hypothetical protein [Blastocatellia bacterium]
MSVATLLPARVQTFSSSGAGATWTTRYKHSTPPELERCGQRATNIQLLRSWSDVDSALQTFSSSGAEGDVDSALQTFSSSGAGATWTTRYKHSAPLELERCGQRATNIQLLRSWSDVDTALITFSSSGAGAMWTARYKHSAPPELRAMWTARYKHSAPPELRAT